MNAFTLVGMRCRVSMQNVCSTLNSWLWYFVQNSSSVLYQIPFITPRSQYIVHWTQRLIIAVVICCYNDLYVLSVLLDLRLLITPMVSSNFLVIMCSQDIFPNSVLIDSIIWQYRLQNLPNGLHPFKLFFAVSFIVRYILPGNH